MTEESSTRIGIEEITAFAAPAQLASNSSGQVTDFAAAALIDSGHPWLDYWHDGGFTQFVDPVYAPYTSSFGESGPSFFPTMNTVEGSTSATVPDPDPDDQQLGGRAEPAELDYGAAIQAILLRQLQQEHESRLKREPELHTPSAIPFPSVDAGGYRDLDRREEERQRVRSMGASSQRGTRKKSGRRDSEGLRATEDTVC